MKFTPLVAAATLTVTLTACGGDPQVAAVRERPPTSATPAIAEQKAVPVVHLNRKTFVPAMTAGMAGLRSWRVSSKLMINGGLRSAMVGVQTTRPAALALRVDDREYKIKAARIIKIKNTVYLSIPGVSPTGKYVKVRADKLGAFGESIDNSDPTRVFRSFGSGLRSVAWAGTEKIDGEPLDRYDVTIDTAKALKALGGRMSADTPKTASYNIWMDSKHRIRVLSFELAPLTMSITLTDFNKPVTVKPPPAGAILSR